MSTPERFWFLFAAYGAFWLLLALFLMHLGRHQKAVERGLRALEARLPGPPDSRSPVPYRSPPIRSAEN